MKRLIPCCLFALGCGAVTSVESIDCRCPPPPPSVGCDASAPPTLPVVEAGGARAVYAWAFHGGPAPPWTFTAFSSETWEAPASGGSVDVPDLQAGDDLFLLGHFLTETDGGEAGLRLAVQEAGEAPVIVEGAELSVQQTTPNWAPVSLGGVWHATSDGPVRVALEGRADPGARIYIQAAAEIVVVHVRP